MFATLDPTAAARQPHPPALARERPKPRLADTFPPHGGAPLIVVAGEALVDIVAGSDGALVGHPGGGPFNVARTVGRLEQPVAYLGRISSDAFGARLRRELEADRVSTETVVATDAPTTLALVELDASGGADYRFYAAGTSAPGLTLEAATAVLPERLDTLYLGTLGLVFEPIATTLEQLTARVGDDTLVALDPNCRPAAIDDPAAYRERLGRILRRADLLKVSDDDLAWLVPGRRPADAARELLGPAGARALVTLGAAGALVIGAGEVVAVEAPPVEVVDTIGAGDAFMGAFLADWRSRGLGRDELARHDELVEATRFACRVAAITCSRPGADPPRRAELES
jgi:fructokinase